jgi:hypothetical protein
MDDSLEDTILSRIGVCGCGDPVDMINYVKGMLDDINNEKFHEYSDVPYMFFCNWFDNEGFLEHGVSVRCCWLSGKGKELLGDIDRHLATLTKGDQK